MQASPLKNKLVPGHGPPWRASDIIVNARRSASAKADGGLLPIKPIIATVVGKGGFKLGLSNL